MPIYKIYGANGKYYKHLKMSKTEARSMRKHIKKIAPRMKMILSKKKRR